MRLHAYMCDRLCECMHACVEDTTCVAAYATASILVWQIMHMYSCRCGRYNMCSRIWDFMPCMHACAADSAVRASLHGRLCNCMPACVAGYAIACMPVWHLPLAKQNVADCATACVADYAAACVPVWWIMQCVHKHNSGADPCCH